MKEPEKLIRKYYADNGITHSRTLLFSYVRKSTTGGDWAILEYYAARYGNVRNKKGKDIVTKLVMRFNPQTFQHSLSMSAIRKLSYSTLIIDHYVFDFHREMTGCIDYSGPCGEDAGTNRMVRCGNWKHELMPASEIPLNDFSGTKYEYCKYKFKSEAISNKTVNCTYAYWAKNPYGNLPDYLRKFNLNPQAMELFATMDKPEYMKEAFLVRLRDDREFAKWYRKHGRNYLSYTPYQIANIARKDIGKTLWELCRDAEKRNERKRRKIASRRKFLKEQRAEAIRIEEAKRIEERVAAERKERIHNLYLKLKSICRKYGAYEVIVPKSEQEMKAEGKRMHNCVGECYPPRQGNGSIVLFIRKNGKRCVDVEICMDTFNVLQCRGVCNEDAGEKEVKFAKAISLKVRDLYLKAA